ncbi:unnamed protein product [Phytomonas sp. Hart1]|nr:unnamed protein product [Phytomonas sp. Hart1]|eukprot:CCW68048.1 unnamed protein product [Phytomonas sp. isolate Hart1]
MHRWISLGGWHGPSLMLTKLGLQKPEENFPFDMIRCTFDGLIKFIEEGFDDEYFPGALKERPFIPDPISSWLLFRGKHTCFTHTDLNNDDVVAAFQNQIRAWEKLFSPSSAEDLEKDQDFTATASRRPITFLRTIIAEDPQHELDLVPVFNEAILRKIKGTLPFRMVMVMHEQGPTTQPQFTISSTSPSYSIHTPCVVWNLKRDRKNALPSSYHTMAMDREEPTSGAQSSTLFDECHDGYQKIITTMSKENKWQLLTSTLPSFSHFVQARRERQPQCSSPTSSSLRSQSSASSLESPFTPYSELSLLEGVPVVRASCKGVGSTRNNGTCVFCGSLDGHEWERREAFDRKAPWEPAEVDQLLLAYALSGGDEVAAVEKIAAEQRRGANETLRQLHELLGLVEENPPTGSLNEQGLGDTNVTQQIGHCDEGTCA